MLVARASATARNAGLDPVVVVIGASATAVLQSADLADADVVVNERWAAGMASSLQLGLRNLQDTAAVAAIVMLVDQPFIQVAALQRLVSAWEAGALIAAAAFDGRVGNPVLFDRSVWDEAAESATGDRGARDLLRERAADVVAVDCDDVARPGDIDTPADYADARLITRPPE